jgi:HEAT repeat protein
MWIQIGRRIRRCGVVSLLALVVPLSGVGEPQTARRARPSRSRTEIDAEMRRRAVSELATLADDQAAAALAAVAVADTDPGVREEAVRGLRGRLPETELPALAQALLDPETRVRAAAIETLSDLGGDGAISALASALSDEDATLREDVVYALGKIGGPTAIAALQEALGDEEDIVRDAAGEVLAELEARQRKRPGK